MSESNIHKQITNFIRHIVDNDLASGKHKTIVTRFPPEPNGFLHVGHAKSICLNFGLARDYQGRCHLRMDDTNPEKEEELYVKSIKEDVKWLGFDWGKHLYHASDYFDQLYDYAVQLIKKGKAYVCKLTAEEMHHYRGTLIVPGKESPDRNRPIEKNLDLFEKMKRGEFEEGSHILRAKIDMSHPNINMRDPVIYRILKQPHQNTGDKWCIYPMYDFAHCLSDMIEGITHSICTLEFEDHRPLYDWYLNELNTPCHPQQIEFARLDLSYTIMSKRKLLELVQKNHVEGWDDPRLPTIAGIKRRGYTPKAIRDFCDRIGVGKQETTIDMTILEDCVREDLNQAATRVMGVLNPIKITITDYSQDKVEKLIVPNHPQDASRGTREMPFSNSIYIDADDFLESPPKDFFRLGPGREVRLRYAYIIKCEEVIKDAQGNVIELKCTHDPNTLGKNPEGRKVKGIIHWVSAKHALDTEVRLYDRLFSVDNPNHVGENKSFLDYLNPQSLTLLKNAKVEPSLTQAKASVPFQFERLGYFCLDPKDSKPENLVFNRIVTLRDTWKKA